MGGCLTLRPRAVSGLADPGGKLIAGERADRSAQPGKNDPPKTSNAQEIADRNADDGAATRT